MKTLVIKNNSEAYFEAMDCSPASLEVLENSVYSFRVNLERVHGTALEKCSEAVDFVFDEFYKDFVENNTFVEFPKQNLGKYTRSVLREYRKGAKNPQMLSKNQENALISMIGSFYYVIKDKSVFNEINVELKDIISLK